MIVYAWSGSRIGWKALFAFLSIMAMVIALKSQLVGLLITACNLYKWGLSNFRSLVGQESSAPKFMFIFQVPVYIFRDGLENVLAMVIFTLPEP